MYCVFEKNFQTTNRMENFIWLLMSNDVQNISFKVVHCRINSKYHNQNMHNFLVLIFYSIKSFCDFYDFFYYSCNWGHGKRHPSHLCWKQEQCRTLEEGNRSCSHPSTRVLIGNWAQRQTVMSDIIAIDKNCINSKHLQVFIESVLLATFGTHSPILIAYSSMIFKLTY